MKKLDLNKKESWREEIIWLRSPFVTYQYLEGFRWLTSHPKPRVGKLKRDKFGKSIKNRFRVCTIWLVGLEEEIIDKDFRQSYWLALQFWVQPNRIFTVGVPQASHGIIVKAEGLLDQQTDPSPNPMLTLTSHLRKNVGLMEG